MRSRSQLGATVLLALVAGCSPPVTLVTNIDAERDAVRARSAEYLQAMARGDEATVMRLMAPDAVVMMPNSPIATTHSEIRSGLQETFALPNISVAWRPTRIDVAASGDIATEVGTFEFGFDGPEGRISDRGGYTLVWRKIGGEWYVASDIATSSMPAAPPINIAVTFDTGATEMLGAADVSWQLLELEGLLDGAQRAVIHGNPAGQGDYTIRLRLPDGYRIPVQWHSMPAHITVLSGEFHMSMGADPDAPTHAHGPGDFLYVPARTPYHGAAVGETILQVHGLGPFAIETGVPGS